MEKNRISDIQQKVDELKNELLAHPDLDDSLKQKIDFLLTNQNSLPYSPSNNNSSGPFNINERFYQLIFEQTPLGVLHFDLNGVITECNERFVDIMGSSKEALVGLNMTELPDQQAARAVKKALSGERAQYYGVYEPITSDKKVPIRVIFEPILDTAGKCIGGIGIAEDESEIFETVQALRESNNRYRNVFEKSYSVMLIVEPDTGDIHNANNAASAFYGWSKRELRSMKIFDINTMNKDELIQEIKKAIRGKRNQFFFKHRKADGSVSDVEVFSGKITIDQKNFLYSIVHDISERTKALTQLKKFRLGIDRSSNAVFITDYDGNIEYVNPAFEHLYGYTKDEVLGKNPRILKSGYQGESFYDHFWETIKSGEVMSGEIVNQTKNGKLLNIRFSSNPIIDDHDNIIGFIAIQNDITTQKQLEEKLRNSLHEKDILLAEIHHRVKNNLAMISAMMILQANNEESDELKSKLIDSTNRIKAIANVHEHLYEAADFANVEFSKNTETLIRNIIHSVPQKTDICVHNRGSLIYLSVTQGIHCSIIVNEVVTNIIKHAFKNIKKGNITLKISEKNGLITLSIIDDGNPVPENFPDETNASLGLELIHLLTRQLDGKLAFKRLKNGSVFNLVFKKNTGGSTFQTSS